MSPHFSYILIHQHEQRQICRLTSNATSPLANIENAVWENQFVCLRVCMIHVRCPIAEETKSHFTKMTEPDE